MSHHDLFQGQLLPNTAPEWHYKMNAVVNNTNASTLKIFFNVCLHVGKTKITGCSNFTNPYLKEQEEITASIYILIVVGFFAFLLFALMISKFVSKQRENYIDYLYRGKFQGNERRPPYGDTLVAIDKKNIMSELTKCPKTDSSATAAKTPSSDSALRNV